MAPNSHPEPSELDFGKKKSKNFFLGKKWPKGEEIEIEEGSVKPVPALPLATTAHSCGSPGGE